MGQSFEKCSKNNRKYDVRTPKYAEKYVGHGSAIPSSPNLPKVVVFDEILLQTIKMLSGLGFAATVFGLFLKVQKTFKNRQKMIEKWSW